MVAKAETSTKGEGGMADLSGFESKGELAKNHHDAAAQHEEAAHHHREAAFNLAAGDSARAKQHSIAAAEHGRVAGESAAKNAEKLDDYDLDVSFETLAEGGATPQIHSWFLCTPGCEKSGSFCSFCCVGHTEVCTAVGSCK
jgi:gallidermin/nisin family lantibiotic